MMDLNIDILTAESVELLKGMIAIPSPSFEEDEVCTYISKWLSGKGVGHERIGNNIIAEHISDPSRPTLMLCAHIDTVSPSPDYSFDPYRPDYVKAVEAVKRMTGRNITANDIVAGLGSNDDGASAVSMIAAYRYVCHIDSQAGFKAPLNLTNLVLVLTCEEERSGKNGMTGLWGTRLCSRNEMIEGCTVIDHAIIGEPTCMNAATSERGLLVIDATAHGISGHAARNEGRNAIMIALSDIDKIRHHDFGKVSPRMGHVNINITQINAGTAHNVIPDRCDFVIDIRPTEQYTNGEIVEELQKVCESELKPRNLANRSSATAQGSSLYRLIELFDIWEYSSPTTSDWMRVTCDAFKMGPGDSSRSHKKDEFVFTTEIREGIRNYIRFIHDYTLE